MGWGEVLRRDAKAFTTPVGRERFLVLYGHSPCFSADADGHVHGTSAGFAAVAAVLKEASVEDFELGLSGGEVAVTVTSTGPIEDPVITVMAIDREEGRLGLWVRPSGSGLLLAADGLLAELGQSAADTGMVLGGTDPFLAAAAMAWLLANPGTAAELPLLALGNLDDFILVLRDASPAAVLSGTAGPARDRDGSLLLRVPDGLDTLLDALDSATARAGAGSSPERGVAVSFSDGTCVTLARVGRGGLMLAVGDEPGTMPHARFLAASVETHAGELARVTVRRGISGGMAMHCQDSRELTRTEWAMGLAARAIRTMSERLDELPSLADAWQSRQLAGMLDTE